MQSDFAAVRELLECAYNRLTGADAASQRIKDTVDALIEDVAIAECQRSPMVVIPFPRSRRG
ncbi:MAG: hypothetical protein ACTHLP_20300 [Rhizobiaceae bacterium]|jgi:hypothetical protein